MASVPSNKRDERETQVHTIINNMYYVRDVCANDTLFSLREWLKSSLQPEIYFPKQI